MEVNLKPLDQQVVVIVGATSGIGREAAYQFAQRGAHLVIAGRDQNIVNTVVAEVQSEGADAAGFVADVTSYDQMKALAEFAVNTYGRIDTWAHVAGVILYAKAEDTLPGEYEQVMRVNYLGPVHGALAALPYLKRQGGALVVVTSIDAHRPIPFQGAYSAAKHGVKAFLDALRIELAEEEAGVSVTNVMPASINTPLFAKALTRIGVQPAPYPPVYEPNVAAQALVFAAEHPVDNLYAGGAASGFSLIQRISPTLADKFLQGTAFDLQKTDVPKSPNAAHNLYEHVSGYDRVHGEWGGRSMPFSLATYLRTHPKVKMGLLAAGLSALATIFTRRYIRRHNITPASIARSVSDSRLVHNVSELPRKVADSRFVHSAAEAPGLVARQAAAIPKRVSESELGKKVSHMNLPKVVRFRRKVGPVTLPGHIGPVRLRGKIGPMRITPASIGPVKLPKKVAEVELGPYKMPKRSTTFKTILPALAAAGALTYVIARNRSNGNGNGKAYMHREGMQVERMDLPRETSGISHI